MVSRPWRDESSQLGNHVPRRLFARVSVPLSWLGQKGMGRMTTLKTKALLGAALAMLAQAASAAPVVTAIGRDAADAPVSFTYQGVTFTFGATGDLFNPISVRNSASGAFTSFGGFLGIPVTPTSNFVDRGVVTYGPADRFASFDAATPVPFSLGDNFIGLRATAGTSDFFGFAYTTNTRVNSIGFETVAGQAITATVAIPAAIPEPAAWAMMILGVGMVGARARRLRATHVAYAR